MSGGSDLADGGNDAAADAADAEIGTATGDGPVVVDQRWSQASGHLHWLRWLASRDLDHQQLAIVVAAAAAVGAGTDGDELADDIGD